MENLQTPPLPHSRATPRDAALPLHHPDISLLRWPLLPFARAFSSISISQPLTSLVCLFTRRSATLSFPSLISLPH